MGLTWDAFTETWREVVDTVVHLPEDLRQMQQVSSGEADTKAPLLDEYYRAASSGSPDYVRIQEIINELKRLGGPVPGLTKRDPQTGEVVPDPAAFDWYYTENQSKQKTPAKGEPSEPSGSGNKPLSRPKPVPPKHQYGRKEAYSNDHYVRPLSEAEFQTQFNELDAQDPAALRSQIDQLEAEQRDLHALNESGQYDEAQENWNSHLWWENRHAIDHLNDQLARLGAERDLGRWDEEPRIGAGTSNVPGTNPFKTAGPGTNSGYDNRNNYDQSYYNQRTDQSQRTPGNSSPFDGNTSPSTFPPVNAQPFGVSPSAIGATLTAVPTTPGRGIPQETLELLQYSTGSSFTDGVMDARLTTDYESNSWDARFVGGGFHGGEFVTNTVPQPAADQGGLPPINTGNPQADAMVAELIRRVGSIRDPKAILKIVDDYVTEFGEDNKEVLDIVQMTLDAIGFIPAFGEIADALSLALSIVRKDWLGAGLSAFSLIPGLGIIPGAINVARRGVKAVKTVDRLVDVAKHADEIIDVVEVGVKWADDVLLLGKGAVENVTDGVVTRARKALPTVAKAVDKTVEVVEGVAVRADGFLQKQVDAVGQGAKNLKEGIKQEVAGLKETPARFVEGVEKTFGIRPQLATVNNAPLNRYHMEADIPGAGGSSGVVQRVPGGESAGDEYLAKSRWKDKNLTPDEAENLRTQRYIANPDGADVKYADVHENGGVVGMLLEERSMEEMGALYERSGWGTFVPSKHTNTKGADGTIIQNDRIVVSLQNTSRDTIMAARYTHANGTLKSYGFRKSVEDKMVDFIEKTSHHPPEAIRHLSVNLQKGELGKHMGRLSRQNRNAKIMAEQVEEVGRKQWRATFADQIKKGEVADIPPEIRVTFMEATTFIKPKGYTLPPGVNYDHITLGMLLATRFGVHVAQTQQHSRHSEEGA